MTGIMPLILCEEDLKMITRKLCKRAGGGIAVLERG